MDFLKSIKGEIVSAIKAKYDHEIDVDSLTITTTKKEFEGDYTLVMFPLIPRLKTRPDELGNRIGDFLVANSQEVKGYNIIKGFLNLELSDIYWHKVLDEITSLENYGQLAPNGKKVMVEFSSPNTNKPLHLGHIRNILLGWSCSQILETAGYEVIKVQIVNDRGIAICKSMLAWQKFGNGETPASSGLKSDHFVGKYYVQFETKFKEEYREWQSSAQGKAIFDDKGKEGQDDESFFKAYKNSYFNSASELGQEAREMLIAWENNDVEVRALWEKMNGWVYEGFNSTYDAMGVNFDKLYYESNTYILGKDHIHKGLENGIFYQKDDSSIWIDLEDKKLDHKLVLRSDGTSVYMTQDIGTAELRYDDYKMDKLIYTVADEQNYHFQTLFEILKKLKRPYAEGLHHLSYGMIDLTTGKMKSREGTVVDADDLIADTIAEAKKSAMESGMINELSAEEQAEIYRKVGLGALKFFIIKVNPQKRMIFDPTQSVDMQGQTGPYVQNAYVRINSILNKINLEDFNSTGNYHLSEIEKGLLGLVSDYPSIIQDAAKQYDPSGIANYSFALAKSYHRFYHDHPILKAESEEAKSFRIQLSNLVAEVLKKAMNLLGIEMPQRM